MSKKPSYSFFLWIDYVSRSIYPKMKKIAFCLSILSFISALSVAQNRPMTENDYYRIITLPIPENIQLEVGGLVVVARKWPFIETFVAVGQVVAVSIHQFGYFTALRNQEMVFPKQQTQRFVQSVGEAFVRRLS